MHLRFGWRRLTPLVALALGATLLLPGTSLAATSWNVRVGAQSQDKGRQANFFFARDITIDVGDTVQWTQNANEIHTVTFLAGTPRPVLFVPQGNGIAPNPVAVAPAGSPTFDGSAYTNSGLLDTPGQQFKLTFTKAGDYGYVCLVHANMTGTIHVQPAGAHYPRTQAQYDHEANAQIAQYLGQAQGLARHGLADALASHHNQVTAGIGEFLHFGSLAVLRFEPDRKVVHAGDKVTWTNLDPETPHTVTFGTEPPGGPFGAFPPSGLSGPGQAVISSTSQSVNSGFIGADLPFGTTFTATFTTPGTYPYICALHDDVGMVGTITVVP